MKRDYDFMFPDSEETPRPKQAPAPKERTYTCENCGCTVTRPVHKRVRFCSRTCSQAFMSKTFRVREYRARFNPPLAV